MKNWKRCLTKPAPERLRDVPQWTVCCLYRVSAQQVLFAQQIARVFPECPNMPRLLTSASIWHPWPVLSWNKHIPKRDLQHWETSWHFVSGSVQRWRCWGSLSHRTTNTFRGAVAGLLCSCVPFHISPGTSKCSRQRARAFMLYKKMWPRTKNIQCRRRLWPWLQSHDNFVPFCRVCFCLWSLRFCLRCLEDLVHSKR